MVRTMVKLASTRREDRPHISNVVYIDGGTQLTRSPSGLEFSHDSSAQV